MSGQHNVSGNSNGNGKHAINGRYTSELTTSWQKDPRWQGIRRPYTADDVVRLAGTVQIEHTLARMGAERLWRLLHTEPYVAAECARFADRKSTRLNSSH